MKIFTAIITAVLIGLGCGSDFGSTSFSGGQGKVGGENRGGQSGDLPKGQEQSRDQNRGDPSEKSPDQKRGENLADHLQRPKACADGELKVAQVPVTFSKTSTDGCQVKQPAMKPKMTAYTRQTETLTIPENALLCGFDLKAESKEFFYDDEILITFDGYFLAGANHTPEVLKGFGMSEENGLVVWDWDYHYNTKRDRDKGGCADGIVCTFPETQTIGPLEVQVSEAWVRALGKNLNKSTFDLSVIVTGNQNENTDCGHNGIEFLADISYVQ